MKRKKIFTIVLLIVTIFQLAACGGKAPTPADSTALQEKSVDELSEMMDSIQTQMGSIFQENEALWEKVFAKMDTQEISFEITEDYNYGDYLLSLIDAMQEELSAEEQTTLKQGAEKIRDLEKELEPILARHEELLANGLRPSNGTAQTFPAFAGKDLDGNAVDSSLISDHAFTVMNFWFTTCSPCVDELDELEEISHDLAEKGGILIGVNAYTQDGDAQAIAEAKEVLTKKGVTYQNICFGTESEAGKLTEQIFTFPSTYVLDRDGNIIGEPIVGGIVDDAQKEKLYQLIEEALKRDSAKADSAA